MTKLWKGNESSIYVFCSFDLQLCNLLEKRSTYAVKQQVLFLLSTNPLVTIIFFIFTTNLGHLFNGLNLRTCVIQLYSDSTRF